MKVDYASSLLFLLFHLQIIFFHLIGVMVNLPSYFLEFWSLDCIALSVVSEKDMVLLWLLDRQYVIFNYVLNFRLLILRATTLQAWNGLLSVVQHLLIRSCFHGFSAQVKSMRILLQILNHRYFISLLSLPSRLSFHSTCTLSWQFYYFLLFIHSWLWKRIPFTRLHAYYLAKLALIRWFQLVVANWR